MKKRRQYSGLATQDYTKCKCAQVVVLGDINILLSVYGIANSKRYSVFHSILTYGTELMQRHTQKHYTREQMVRLA